MKENVSMNFDDRVIETADQIEVLNNIFIESTVLTVYYWTENDSKKIFRERWILRKGCFPLILKKYSLKVFSTLHLKLIVKFLEFRRI